MGRGETPSENKFWLIEMFELYAMKVARTVLGGGKIRENPTYLNRPYAALL